MDLPIDAIIDDGDRFKVRGCAWGPTSPDECETRLVFRLSGELQIGANWRIHSGCPCFPVTGRWSITRHCTFLELDVRRRMTTIRITNRLLYAFAAVADPAPCRSGR